jgi:DNA polymerase-3 subunit epsilon
MNSFTAIDFETAHPKRWSICQVGLVRVEKGVIKEQLSILVQPPDNMYWNMFTDIHGITAGKTARASTFDIIWPQIEPYITNTTVVAHNGAFDFSCLKQTLEYYEMAVPVYTGECTYKIYNDNLASLCKKHKINLNHHDALSDAMACAELYGMHLSGI